MSSSSPERNDSNGVPKVLFFMLRLADERNQLTGGTVSTFHILLNSPKIQSSVLLNSFDIAGTELNRNSISSILLEIDYPWKGYSGLSLFDKLRVLYDVYKYNLSVADIITNEQIDVVHCDEMGAALVFWGAYKARKKLLIYVRNDIRGERIGWVYKLPMMFADSIVAISRELCNKLRLIGGKAIRHKVTSIYNSVNAKEINNYINAHTKQSCINKTGISHRAVNVGIVAAVESRKNQYEFIKNIVARYDQHVNFYFIGGIKEQGYYELCDNFIRANSIVNCNFVNFTEDIYCWYRALDIVCLPSLREGVPRALVEASAFGLPVVAFNIQGCREAVINEETGYLVDDFDQMNDCIRQLVLDPNLRRRMGDNGLRHVEDNFDVVKNNERLANIYYQLAYSHK